MTPPALSAAEVARALAERLEPLLRQILPRGELWGNEYVALNPMRDDRHLGSFRISVSGHKRGRWADFALGNAHGDALDLVAYLGFDGDMAAAYRWALGWLGRPVAPAELARGTAAAAASAGTAEARRAAAVRMWREAERAILGTPVDRYLLGRGIDLRLLPRLPSVLRYHPGLTHPETRGDGPPETRPRHPAMLAWITRPDGAPAVHRTYLELRADGTVGKLSGVKDAKLTLGGVGGGSIRLSRGAAGTPWKLSRPAETIALGEGIEDALSAAVARPDWRAAAVVALANLAAVALPPGNVLVLGQNERNDKAVADVQRTFDRALRRWHGEGRQVWLAHPPRHTKDVNDVLRGAA